MLISRENILYLHLCLFIFLFEVLCKHWQKSFQVNNHSMQLKLRSVTSVIVHLVITCTCKLGYKAIKKLLNYVPFNHALSAISNQVHTCTYFSPTRQCSQFVFELQQPHVICHHLSQLLSQQAVVVLPWREDCHVCVQRLYYTLQMASMSPVEI